MVRRLTIVGAVACLALAPPAQAGRGMYVGAADDAAKSVDAVFADGKMTLAALAGFNSVRLTTYWSPGQTQLDSRELVALRNAAGAAQVHGIRVVLSVYHRDRRTTPLTPRARAQFARFTASIARAVPSVRDFIIGNEPNLNRFWMPQFGRRGVSASPAAYLRLLVAAYDALKRVSPNVTVIGGALAPRGQDKATAARHTHSPTRFVLELGRAYRKLKRSRPIMDQFAIHPYGDNSSQPPEYVRHPKSRWMSLSSYTKLVTLLDRAFGGTAQEGATLPIVYAEYGVDSRIPVNKAKLYSGREPRTTRPVDEWTQGDYYRRALAIAYCQPTVKGFLIFHLVDEFDLDRWQSGIYYADATPKRSFGTVKRAVTAVRTGTITRCSTAEWRTRIGGRPGAPPSASVEPEEGEAVEKRDIGPPELSTLPR